MAKGKVDVTEELRNSVKKTYRRDINKGYIILYLGVFILIIIGEVVLAKAKNDFSLLKLVQDIISNLMGVLAAFLIFDIAHEKISKDAYASEVSEQILNTLMYHPEAMELYENSQKKTFVNAFIGSIVEDSDASYMINSFLNSYLLTPKDFLEANDITDKDCRIRTSFSYRFVLEDGRTEAFKKYLTAEIVDGRDPYFYVQEELNYHVKYLADKGNNTSKSEISIGFVYDNEELDRFLRGDNNAEREVRDCIFRENLDIEECDKEMLKKYALSGDLKAVIESMFRPRVTIDRQKGILERVEIISNSCMIVTFQVDHDITMNEHDIGMIFHMPKRWDSIIEIALVEPTKDPMISVSYNEDTMSVEMFSFLNKGEASSYKNTSEHENGIYSISLSNEWVFPISGVVFPIKRKKLNHE